MLVKELRAELKQLKTDTNRQIENMQKLLDQSQQLQLMAEKKIAVLEAPKETADDVDQNKESPVTSAPQAQKKETTVNEKRGFWHKLFK